MATYGLVLTGGGARAAYQAGAIHALAELAGVRKLPFRVLAGVSAGAINAAFLAAHADDFPRAARMLRDFWHRLTPDHVYRTDMPRLAAIGSSWLRDLSLGGLLGASPTNFLLDTAPLRGLLAERLPLTRIGEHLSTGRLRGLAVTATIISPAPPSPSSRPTPKPVRGCGAPARATHEVRLEHVLASAAIPLFFPPVAIDGAFHGDGCVRMHAPTSPAIHLGADRLLAIGIRYARTGDQTLQLNDEARSDRLAVADIVGVLLNAVFLDSLEADLELLERINRTIAHVPLERHADIPGRLRAIPVLALQPSQDLGRMAVDQYDEFPRVVRYLLRGIGATGERGWDLLSYLAFEPGYVRRLLELGYSDVMARRDELTAFLADL
ncbi:patatin-like phospholipase family protein [Nannocystis pusilla]|uniref:Patatin-like phospholipase family protein n=1 Tax=Nannocystis pusilla TaxID=889268 RepID=A0A9X3EM72_9BACT|nr:patatin-like phospholipase family protein [Nannocystis pusilla]